jgi:hypothetical protein
MVALPALCGLAVAPAPAQSWEFNTGTTEGWYSPQGVSNLHTSGGSLVGDVTGRDPYLIGPRYPDINASALRYVRIRMKTNAGSRAEFFWKTAADPSFRAGREVAFPLNADDQLHEYTVDMSSNPRMSSNSRECGTLHV